MNFFDVPITGDVLRVLQRRDPGLLRLKKAVRIVLAACISLMLPVLLLRVLGRPIHPASLSLAGTVTMLLLLLTNGPSRRVEQITLAITGLFVLAEVPLVYLIPAGSLWHTAILCTLAFGAFYARRFGVQYVGAGLTVFFCFALLGSLITPAMGLASPLLAVGPAIPVAYVVNFYVLPNRPAQAYRVCIARFMGVSAGVASRLRKALEGVGGIEGEYPLRTMQRAITRCETAGRYLPLTSSPQLRALEIFMRRTAGSLMMLTESMAERSACSSPPLHTALVESLRVLNQLLQEAEHAVLSHEALPAALLNELHTQQTRLRGLLENDADLFSGGTFFLARSVFALGRLDTVLHEWPVELERSEL